MAAIDPEGKTIWITGASSGIGRYVAEEFARRGSDLILSARREETLNEVAENCSGVSTTVCPMDVTNREEHERVVETIDAEYGGLDVAFFNAGVYSDMPTAIDSEAFETDFDVNFMGVVYGIEAALPLLQESPAGRVVAMSSASAYTSLPKASSYGASKAAVKYMVESLRFEWRDKDVDVDLTVVCPGFVKTPMTADNEFPMPFLMDVDQAADIVVNGILRGKNEIGFPIGLVLPLKLLNKLPAFIYNPLVSYLTGMT